MTVNQVYSLLNDTATQCFGAGALATLDLENMLALRETVAAFGSDKFLNALVDRIGKTVLRTLDFTATFPKFLMDEFTFGAVLQKINVQPFAAVESKQWEVGDVGFTPNNFEIAKPTVLVDYFQTSNTWEVYVSIPDRIFMTAFDSATAMTAFITAIFDSMNTSLNIQLENETRLAILGMVGEKVNANNGCVDLLALYNDFAATPITTAAEAMHDKEFLRFAGMTIRNYIAYLGKPSVLYNVAGRVRATTRDNMHVLMLTEFESAYSSYVVSDTFQDIIRLPYYTSVEYWQATGNSAPNFDDCSAYDIEIPSNGTAVKGSGLVCMLCDREAIATGLFDRFSAADRNNRNRVTGYTEGVTIQSIVDTSENCVCFFVVDQTP